VEKVTKKDVREAFTRARSVMRFILDNLDTDDYTESGDLGQAILELRAECGIALDYAEYKEQLKYEREGN
jgi:hypothetical protein